MTSRVHDELMRRIEAALDSDAGIDADTELRASLDRDPDAASYARSVQTLNGALRGLGRAPERDWDRFADAIDARLALGEKDDGFDATAPVHFADDSPPRTEIAPVASRPSEARVVKLADRRRANPAFVWMGALAAAAAVGLGIAFGVDTMDRTAQESVALAPASVERSEEESAQAVVPMPSPAPAAAVAAPDEFALAESAEVDRRRHPTETMPAADEMLGDDLERAEPLAVGGRAGGAGAEGVGPGAAPRATAQPRDLPQFEPMAPAAPPSVGATATAQTQAHARPQVIDALARALDPVQRCIGAERVVARVTVDVSADGAIQRVAVEPFTGPSATCIERAVRAVAMPAFGEPYRATHAYRPAPYGASGVQLAPSARPAARSRAARQPASESLDNADVAEHR